MKKILLLSCLILAQISFAQVIQDREVIDIAIEEPVVESNPEIPFSVVENPPIYEGCQDFKTKEEQKKCFTESITKHIEKTFNTDLANNLDLKPGPVRMFTFFKISTQGDIIDVKSRAPHSTLYDEASRVINLIPKMHAPGTQRGKPVMVTYAVPISFNVDSNVTPKQPKTTQTTKQKK